MIFAVLDVLLAVNLCINCSFFTFIMENDDVAIDTKVRLLKALMWPAAIFFV